MYRSTLFLSSVALAISGCGSTTTITPSATIAPSTAASGYATEASTFSDPDDTITRIAQMQSMDWDTGTTSQKTVTFDVSATGNTVNDHPEFLITYKGIAITVAWDLVEERYEGTNGDIFVAFSTWYMTPNGQLTMSWANISDDTVAQEGIWGLTLVGFNSDPDVVSGRTGTAEFTGWGGINLNAEDNSFFTVLDGVATLAVNFDGDTITGSIDLTECVGCTQGAITITPTTMTLNEMSIADNTFTGTASIDPADLGLSSIGTISVDGMFYEAGATAVGGYVSGVGAQDGTGETTFLNGAFIANE